ncbi:MAG: hypothetical protein FJ285_03145 [Planctomycetes bacterium]|nr:hypothetical protein [Planctomycetota bacterium]
MEERTRRRMIIAVAVAFAATLAVGAWFVDRNIAPPRQSRGVPVEDLVAPSPLSVEEREAARERATPSSSVQLEQGAWVQVAGPDGRLAQQYSARKIDPEPGAFLSMDRPQTVFFLEDGRVATLRADSGRVRVPNRALESGIFRGDVVIRMFRPFGGKPVDLTKDQPSLILESEELDFDQTLGTIRCPTAFRLTTDVLTFDGEGLDLLLSGDRRTIERLLVERPLGPIVIDRQRLPASQALGDGAVVSPRGDAPRLQRAAAPLLRRARWAPLAGLRARTPLPSRSSPDAAESPSFYRLELHDSVEVLRQSPNDRAWTRGDLLVAVFALENDLLSGGMVDARDHRAPRAAWRADALRTVRATPIGWRGQLAQLVLAAALPRARVDDLLIVRFKGQLEMRPLAADAPRPPAADAMIVEIDGQGMELANQAGLALRARSVDIDVRKTAGGQSAPKHLKAVGGVEATDALQTLWCDSLDVAFTEMPMAGQAAAVQDPALGAVEASQVDAVGGVQVQLKDGARIFAQSLSAQPPAATAQLQGPGISVVRAGMLLDGIPQVQVAERERDVKAVGGGRARNWKQSVFPADARGKLELPIAPPERPELDAKWSGGMSYRDRAADGALLELTGDVRVRAEPRAEEFDALDGQSVLLEFEPMANTVQGGRGESAAGADMRVRRLITVGDARLENQVWANAARAGAPRLFQLRSQRVEYDAQSSELSVPGAGTVLVHVPAENTADAAVKARQQRDQGIAGGGVEGTSRFRWGGSMDLKRVVDQRYLMTMQASVELVRAGDRPDQALTMTCDRLEAAVLRGEQTAGTQETFSLGGSIEVQRIRGIGRCFIRTPQYDIECEEFDYNVVTQVAELRGRTGRLVQVLPKRQGEPLKAASMLWDMQSGRIRVRAGSGGAGL